MQTIGLVLGLPTWAVGLLVAFFVLISLVLVLIVLIQKPQGGGLSGAFGAGGGSGQTAFGTKTGDVLTMTTITIFVLWLLIAIVLNYATRPQTAPPPPGIAPGPAEPVEPEGVPAGEDDSSAPDGGEAADSAGEPDSQERGAGETNQSGVGEDPAAPREPGAEQGEAAGPPEGTGGGTPGV